MKTVLVLKRAGFVLILFVLAACTKYEEGSKFTFLTAKDRMVGEWTVTNITYDNNSVTSSYPFITMSIKKDQTYKTVSTSGSTSITEIGTWAFNSDKTHFIQTRSDGQITDWIIMMLRNKMVKLKKLNSQGISTVYTLEQ